MKLASVNPTTLEVIASYDALSDAAVAAALERSAAAFRSWRETSFGERAAILRAAAAALRGGLEEHARLMALEMGKPIRQGRAEVEKCAWACDYYAENAERFLASEEVPTDAARSFVAYEPLGTILAVMPWNFPYWQVFRFAAPALMAGNVALLKHASNVCGCSLAIEEVFRRAGLPAGAFRSLLVPSGVVERLIAHPAVKAVTLTGSAPAGRAVARAAGELLKKAVLELGGSDPYVVLEDADLERAAAISADSRCVNSGQSCIAAKRFIAPKPIMERFERLFVECLAAKTVGDPLDETTEIGPLARLDLRDELHGQVERSVERGARLLLGGEVPSGPGAFYPPTALAGAAPGMPAYDEELFGPVAALIAAADEEDALRIANDTSFGLGAAVFTRDASRGERIATSRLEAGSCFVNASVKSDPRLPFGGIKESGFGRELSHFGIREFVNIKTVYRA